MATSILNGKTLDELGAAVKAATGKTASGKPYYNSLDKRWEQIVNDGVAAPTPPIPAVLKPPVKGKPAA
jgi:hypothetical protein